MSVGRMPRTFAQTADLSGCALRKATICSGSQLPCRRVPPNRPGVPPEHVPPLPGGGLSPGWSVPTGVRFLLVSQLLLRLRPRPDPTCRRPAHGRSRYKTVRLASLMCRTLCRTCPSACSPELLPDGGSRHVAAPPHICRLSPRLGNEASITRARERPVHTSSPPPLATLSTSAARAQRPGGQRPIVPPASPPPAWPRAFFAAGRAGHRWRASTRLARDWPRRLRLLLTYCVSARHRTVLGMGWFPCTSIRDPYTGEESPYGGGRGGTRPAAPPRRRCRRRPSGRAGGRTAAAARRGASTRRRRTRGCPAGGGVSRCDAGRASTRRGRLHG